MADDQIARLQTRLNSIPKALTDAMQPALAAAGQELVDAMQAMAEPSRKTGALIDSIAFTTAGNTTPPYSQPGGSQVVPDNAVVVTAGNSAVRYAHFVEYGTSRSHAEPFFWPAYRALQATLAAEIKAAVHKALAL